MNTHKTREEEENQLLSIEPVAEIEPERKVPRYPQPWERIFPPRKSEEDE